MRILLRYLGQSMPKKVVIIGSRGIHFQYSGIENALKELLPRIKNQNPKFHFIVYGFNLENNKILKVRVGGIEHVLIPKWIWKLGGNSFASLFSFLHSNFIQKISLHWYFASGPSIFSFISFLLGKPSIAAIRSIDSQREKWNFMQKQLLKLGEFVAFNFATIATVNSKPMEEYFSKYQPVYIPNGYSSCEEVDDSVLTRYGISKNNYILFAARLVPEKRCHTLIQAVNFSNEKYKSGIKLVVAGGQSSKSYFNQLQSISDDSVIFAGHLSKPLLNSAMKNARMFVLPSLVEGMSNSLLSAMSEGICCLCSDIPENIVLIKYKELIFKRDDMKDLSSKINLYWNNDQKRLHYGKQLKKEVVCNYSWDFSAKRYSDTLSDLIKINTSLLD